MKHNGNGNGKGIHQNGKAVEKYHFENPDEIPMQNGISIASAGDGDTPTEVHIYTKVPGAQFASRFTFREPELLTDFIEQLIAYRRLVFPDAREINTNITMDDTE